MAVIVVPVVIVLVVAIINPARKMVRDHKDLVVSG
jgi:hypothetical protein